MLNDFIAIDVETSGLNFREDQIIEVCVALVSDGYVVSTFNALVYPHNDLFHTGLDEKVTELTGHTMADLERGIPEEDLACILNALIRPFDVPIVAYNGLFDWSFIHMLLTHHGFDPLTHDFLDPCTIARDRKGYPHRLGPVCSHYGIKLEDAHSAEADTLALVDLVLAMQDEDKTNKGRKDWKTVDWYINKAGYLRKYEEPEWFPEHVELYPQGQLPEVVKNVKKKPIPKYAPVVSNNADKKKKRPDFEKMDAHTFDKEHMPTGFLAQHYKEQIDTFFEDPLTGEWLVLNVPGMQSDEGKLEFDRIINYVTHVHKLTDAHINSHLDNPDEACIELRKLHVPASSLLDEDPFAYTGKGPIEISEDDLPF